MDWVVSSAPWLAAAGMAILALVLLRRQLRGLLALLARTGVGLAVLACVSTVSGVAGITLGVNLPNALVLGLLGAPGFGLLLMVNWVLRA